MPKRAYFELFTGNKVHRVLGLYFTEAIKEGISESGAARVIQGSAQPQRPHRAATYTKQERAGTLSLIVPCSGKQTAFNQKLYIIGNKLGQTKTRHLRGTGNAPTISQEG